ncbi:alpha/beta fold hydrolase [Streptomyces sp. NPDC094147]|uniref:alpha/beta fold hydrolase n=1 Tax=Streptomyces sp. NPDC094147 TaxID=3366057 RepID=UPI00381E855D
MPLDRTSPKSPTIDVGFAWFPARDGRAQGTIVAIEGGPGYPTTGDTSRTQYQAMLGPLQAHRNLLLYDLRGTGRSQALNCPGLSAYSGQASGPAFAQAVGACGTMLNDTWQYSDGTPVQAADLFGTANAARDLDTVLHRLGQGKVDLYGDSYGSWFAQAFASRYPAALRSVVLDATYEVLGLDPWYTSTVTSARTAFDRTCERSPACPRTHTWAVVQKLADRLRTAPVTGTTPGPNGRAVSETVTVTTLVDIVNNAASDPGIYKALGAAAQAAVSGDDQPLLRLAAQSVAPGESLPESYSRGLYFAVACTDYPQLFSMTSGPEQRRRQLAHGIDQEPPGVFEPFRVPEWLAVDAYTNAYDACLDWPAPTHPADPPITATPPMVPPTVPVLLLSGDLDLLTPPQGGRTVAAQIGPSARFVEITGVTHVTAMPDTRWPGLNACGASLYRRFIDDPKALPRLDTSCSRTTPPIPVLGSYPLTLDDAAPAIPAPGDQSSPTTLRAAQVGVSVVGDAITRSRYVTGQTDTGLRGGTWTCTTGTPAVTFTFNSVGWVTDATVSGTATWNQDTGTVSAALTVSPTNGQPLATIHAAWNTLATRTPATVHGDAGGKTLNATLPVP